MQSEKLFFNAIGDIKSNRNYIFQSGKTFFAKLYGASEANEDNFIERVEVPVVHLSKKLASEEALEHHLMRAHLQTMMWKAADQQGLIPTVSFDITNFGWKVLDGIPLPVTTK